ncbi:MAG: hypothetical protein A2937_01505 [Candidatus Yonathbacteria bacterium RIFCSPLOWO2_01_FULL_47_33b]|uniref:Uncharacterized protein n=1 Tax=Candidatus Yonathbacteria bacterium RIFCSPLOWO2_01_FULL_47_33b TaxID=1802727 RepID=A0A1G2SH29_9BACT|nr:MAG: hypothetical protein A2937_01505 [Candidatus Yonathbacteria bacterium RIFCSPLOWO2_01_FULL_47_33b]
MKTIFSIVIGLAVMTPTLASACFSNGGFERYGMMGYGYGGGAHVFMVAGGLVWIVVGILAGVWLWQQINKK